MILFLVGLPGPLARWCDAVMACLAGRLGGDVSIGTWPTLHEMFPFESSGSVLESLGPFLVETRARHVVIGARQPDRGLRLLFAECRTRFVLALDDPADAVAAVIGKTGVNLQLAVGAVAKSCPSVMPFAGLPGALAIDAAAVGNDPDSAIAAIAAHFGIEADWPARAAVLDAVGPRGGEAARRQGRAGNCWRSGFPPPARRWRGPCRDTGRAFAPAGSTGSSGRATCFCSPRKPTAARPSRSTYRATYRAASAC